MCTQFLPHFIFFRFKVYFITERDGGGVKGEEGKGVRGKGGRVGGLFSFTIKFTSFEI